MADNLPFGYADILGSVSKPFAARGGSLASAYNPSSLAAMFSDVPAGGVLGDMGLTSHSVHTVQIDPYSGNPVNVGDLIVDRPAPTQVAGRTSPVSNENPLNMDNLGVTHDYFRTPAVAPGVSAIERAAPRRIADLYGGTGVAGNALFGYGNPGTVDFSVANGGDTGLFGVPAQGRYAGNNSGTPPARRVLAPPPPPTPVQSLAAQFTPAAQPPLMSGDLYGSNRGFGGENAQMPDSMNNSRWRTGY